MREKFLPRQYNTQPAPFQASDDPGALEPPDTSGIALGNGRPCALLSLVVYGLPGAPNKWLGITTKQNAPNVRHGCWVQESDTRRFLPGVLSTRRWIMCAAPTIACKIAVNKLRPTAEMETNASPPKLCRLLCLPSAFLDSVSRTASAANRPSA